MKAYVRSFEEIKEAGLLITDKIHRDNFVMPEYCGKGPFDFIKMFRNNKEWYCSEKGYNWHISWLKPITENKQYLLEFE